MAEKLTVPVFFSTDAKYLPFLAVAIRSLIDNSSEENDYVINVLNDGLPENRVRKIKAMETDNVKINFFGVKEKVEALAGELNLRDYFTISIYFRLFIPSMFPHLKKALYMDCDIVILDDVAKLYKKDLEGNVLGVVSDQIIAGDEVLHVYSEKALGIKYREYFNSGILLMDLNMMREMKIEEQFVELLNKYDFRTIAPDQDYLNVLCRDKVMYLDRAWNVMSSKDEYFGELRIIHFNMFNKPWLYSKVRFCDYFWKYAKKTDFMEEIKRMKKHFQIWHKLKDRRAYRKMIKTSKSIVESDNNFFKTLSPEETGVVSNEE